MTFNLPCVITLGEQVESFCESAQFGVHGFCCDVQYTAVSNSWGRFLECLEPTQILQLNLNVLKSR